MKASEVLKRYAAGRRDFSGENLRGQSFKGQDLSGADFSEADIRGANFTNAYLKSVKFRGVKAGLQLRWAIFLVSLSFLASSLSGVVASFAGAWTSFILSKDDLQLSLIVGIVSLVALIVFLIIIIRKGLSAAFVAIAGTVACIVAIFGAVNGAFTGGGVGAAVFTKTVAISSVVAGAVGSAVTFAIMIASAIASAVAIAVAFAVAFALASAVTITIGGIIAFTLDSAISATSAVTVTIGRVEGVGVVTLDSVVAIAVAIIAMLLSTYICWRAIAGDQKYSFIQEIAITIAAMGGTSFRNANLSDADFTEATLKSTDFRKAQLIRTLWHQTKMLDRVRPGITYLKDAKVRQVLITRQGQAQNFDRYNLRGVNLQGANLVDTSFIGADLSQANLQDTDLSRAKLVQTQLDYTNLAEATLTGACIEDWGITPETKLNGIQCEYVFMRLADSLDPNPHRKPDDWNKNFEDGEFADFIAPMVQTLDLYHNQVDDPRLIAIAFQQLTETHPEAELDIVSIEKRGKHRDKVLIRAETSPQANRSELHHAYFTTYNELQALSPAALQQLLAEKDGQVKMLTGLVEAAIKRPGISAQTYYSQGDTMSENSEIQVSAGGSVGAVGGGDVSNPGVMNLGEISGSVSNSLNQLPESPEPDKPGIKELLAQLQAAIEAESNLDEEDKAEALEQVKTLAEAGKNPQEKGNQKMAKRATTMLKGIIVGLPTAATLFEAWNKLQPLITKLFGL
jgi:uncharacterized protein YjbI with pentapeptide repeats